MVVLDTDIVSNLRKKKPHPKLLAWIESIGWQTLRTTVFTIMEIQIGIERAKRTDPSVADSVAAWLDGLIAIGQPQILDFDFRAARLYAKMHETPALRSFIANPTGAKQPKTGADLAIAAIAITRTAVVATNNDADFLEIHRHFPLPGLFNPFADEWRVEPPGT